LQWVAAWYDAAVKQTIALKLAPSAEQAKALLATMERFNVACDHIAEVAYARRLANKLELQRLVYYDVRQRFGLSAQLTIRAIAKVVEAYKRDKRIRPRFRQHGAVCYDQRIMRWLSIEAVSLKTLAGRIQVPIRFGAYQAACLDRRQGQADLIWRDGVFYLYATIEVPEPPPGEPEEYLGIDLGIVNLAADSDGGTYSGEAVERHRRIDARRRRNLQRRGTKAARRKLRRLGRRRSRYQRDTNHCISKAVVRTAKGTGRGIALEELKGIRDRTTVSRRQRARHGNWSFAQLRSFIGYKARLAGVRVVAVDPCNTSRTCPACGHCEAANRRTQAAFCCLACGHAAPADTTAARNIASRAVRARAAVMRPNELAGLKVSDAA
jgi:putative transposase